MGSSRVEKIMNFLIEIDKAKNIFRRNYICDGSRRENDAEHSWHISVMAMLIKEFGPADTDISKVIKMLLVHDLVEVYAGDTYCYDKEANKGKEEREEVSAKELFGILPEDLNLEFYGLWREFEAGKTNEAVLAGVCDKLQPLLLNYISEGGAWKENDITKKQVLERTSSVKAYSKELWEYVEAKINDACEKGYLK